MQKLYKNIGCLVQVNRQKTPVLVGEAMQTIPCIENAWLLTNSEKIHSFGQMADCPNQADQVIDVDGQWIFPAWVDSHSHLVFAATREGEFVDRIKGLSYAEIAAKGGGILNSARRLQEASEEQLFMDAKKRLHEVAKMGTGVIEIKSGYGLTPEAEIKMLRVAHRLKAESNVAIRTTFLGAHALPMAFKENRKAYLDQVVEEMLPAIAEEKLADYIDVFCEKGFFTLEEMNRVIEAGAKYGMKAKVHVNQFNSFGAIKAAVDRGAVSVDHLEVFNDTDVAVLQNADTIATLLPSAPFFLSDHYPQARRLLDAGVKVALATDLNPGTSPSGKMAFVVALGCIKCGMLPEEAINAATLNGAAALELSHEYGSIDQGKIASFFMTDPLPSLAYVPYAFGSDLVKKVILKGEEFE